MNAARFMDKQIMDLSRSKSDLTSTANKDLLDLMNPQSEDHQLLPNKHVDHILPNYDFHPIHRPSSSADHLPVAVSNPDSPPLTKYSSKGNVDPDKSILEKTHKTNDSSMLSEFDQTMQKYTDKLMHAIDTVSGRLSQLESRTRNLELSVEDLKISMGNNHGSADGKLRQLENILLEVQTSVHNLKDKQEVMEGHMQLAKLQISKVEQSSELPNTVHQEPVQQPAGASAPPQQSALRQFPISVPQSIPSMPLSNVSHPSSHQNIHLPPPVTSQFPPAVASSGPQRDAYFLPPTQPHEAPSQQYQAPPPAQLQQQPLAATSQPQQYQPAPTQPYHQPPQPPQQSHLSVASTNAPPPFQPPLAHRPDESPYVPPQTYPPNLHQPPSQPSNTPPHSQLFYGSPSSMYEPPQSAKSSSGFPPAYVPPSGPNEPYPYGGPPSHYGSGPSVKTQPLSPGGSAGNYPQLPTARILPQAIPTASGIGSNSGGSGNRVPIDDVVDKVTNMGFSREQVRATVRRLTENGQSVDLNVVLDKLMNDADVQPPRGWFNR